MQNNPKLTLEFLIAVTYELSLMLDSGIYNLLANQI